MVSYFSDDSILLHFIQLGQQLVSDMDTAFPWCVYVWCGLLLEMKGCWLLEVANPVELFRPSLH